MKTLSLVICFLLMASFVIGCGTHQTIEEHFIGGLPLEIVSMDPHKAIDLSSTLVTPLIFEGLVAIGSDGNWKGVLAESWDVSTDGLQWTFNLRHNVIFHNRRPMVAADVIYSLNRILDKSNGALMYSVLSDEIKDVQTIDDFTIRIILSRPSGTLLSELGLGERVAIIAKEEVNTEGNITYPIGTGPYKFVSWQPSISWEAKRFDSYWGKKSKIETVTFVTLTDDTARFIALQKGEVDWIESIPFDMVAQLQSTQNNNIKVFLNYQNNAFRINFNSTRSPMSDHRVRQAVAYAIDKEEINQAICFGAGVVTNQPFLTESFMHLDVEDIYGHHDIQKAKELLLQSRYPNGITLVVIHPQGFSPGLWDIIAAELKPAGITLDVQLMDIPQFLQRLQTFDYDMAGDEQSSIFNWDRTFAYFQKTSSSNWLVGGYDNPDVSLLIDEGRKETDLNKAKKIYTEVLNKLQDDAATLFILSKPEVQVIRTYIAGFSPNQMNGALIWPGGGLNYAVINR